ncbi:MAG: glutamyl-tRNA amidotransferase [Candidatus Marinimicrobia bacterium]|nr:glutamyl-tRNA amidotransferase [Candidatus Neomarinimicrobiota bacterium]|tara:strand:- start:12407 stop:12853 length:447 start_codon:yes stop_codon:yes gene_type:complete
MTLVKELQSAMQTAMKSGDSDRVRTLRTLLAKLKEGEIEKGDELSKEELIKILQTAAKQRKEAADMYSDGGRTELADAELKELDIIEEYLPEQLSEEQVTLMIEDAIGETGAESLSDMGKVMPVIMKKAAGQADGKTIQEIVKRKLSD